MGQEDTLKIKSRQIWEDDEGFLDVSKEVDLLKD